MKFKLPKLPQTPSFLKNKYIIASLAVFIWLLFFDNNNFFQQYRFSQDIKRLQREKAYYIKEIEKDSIMRQELKENPEALEKFAREQYYLKKEGEDIFIVKPDQR
ncbi:MAG: septum formation initiator family protein [Bacteroidetes bacterium]|nr:septum formation initiator family protein [Bacteroidota bacterium]